MNYYPITQPIPFNLLLQKLRDCPRRSLTQLIGTILRDENGEYLAALYQQIRDEYRLPIPDYEEEDFYVELRALPISPLGRVLGQTELERKSGASAHGQQRFYGIAVSKFVHERGTPAILKTLCHELCHLLAALADVYEGDYDSNIRDHGERFQQIREILEQKFMDIQIPRF